MKAKRKQKAAQSKPEFKVGDLVGAKVKGYPLWPAEIIEAKALPSKRQICTVKFFGRGEIAKGNIVIKHFKDFTVQEKGKNCKGFQPALKECEEQYRLRHNNNEAEFSDNEPTKESPASDTEEVTDQVKSSTSTISSPSVQDESNLSIVEEDLPKVSKFKKPKEAKKEKKKPSVKGSVKEEKKQKSEKVAERKCKSSDETATKTRTSAIDSIKLENGNDRTSMTIDVVSEETEALPQHPNTHDLSPPQLSKPEIELKSEGENEGQQTTIIRENTIQKLKKKINEKMEEKQSKKEAVKEVKRLRKIKKVLEGATENLVKFSSMSERILQIDPLNTIELDKWNKQRELFEDNTLKMLDECIKRDPRGKLSAERRTCHEKLMNLLNILKRGNKSGSDQLSDEIKSVFSLLVDQIRSNKLDSVLIPAVFGTRNKAMLERKENDAE